jgi:hypothetical protein
MSARKTTLQYALVAILVSLGIVAASFLYIGLPMSTNQSAPSQGGQLAPLSIQLTDPPQVPSLTTSLNLTYSSLDLLVGEPAGTQGQLNTQSVTVTPTGGSATIDLLKLQNVSQTIAVASLPSGSVLYSVTFAVSKISIDVNNTISAVTLATGGSSFEVTIAHPSAFNTGDYALLQLNPVVVDTPSGYQLIPSSVGVMGHGEGLDHIGNKHQLSNNDNNALGSARGNVASSITALSVVDNTTTFTVLVNNSANVPVDLVGIGIHGNFTVLGDVCMTFGNQVGDQPMGGDSSHTGNHMQGHDVCTIPMHMDEVVFIPVSTPAASSTTTSCSAAQLALVNGGNELSDFHKLTIAAGQCIIFTFSGTISFGDSSFVLVPSTAAGQVYVLHVIASNGANQQVSCTLPLGASSCTVVNGNQGPNQDSQDW